MKYFYAALLMEYLWLIITDGKFYAEKHGGNIVIIKLIKKIRVLVVVINFDYYPIYKL